MTLIMMLRDDSPMEELSFFFFKSIVSPVLFVLYINDVVSNLECPILLYAVDAEIFTHVESEEDIKARERDVIKLNRVQ